MKRVVMHGEAWRKFERAYNFRARLDSLMGGRWKFMASLQEHAAGILNFIGVESIRLWVFVDLYSSLLTIVLVDNHIFRTYSRIGIFRTVIIFHNDRNNISLSGIGLLVFCIVYFSCR